MMAGISTPAVRARSCAIPTPAAVRAGPVDPPAALHAALIRRWSMAGFSPNSVVSCPASAGRIASRAAIVEGERYAVVSLSVFGRRKAMAASLTRASVSRMTFYDGDLEAGAGGGIKRPYRAALPWFGSAPEDPGGQSSRLPDPPAALGRSKCSP